MAEGVNGHQVVPEYWQRLAAEHHMMLDYLKKEFTAHGLQDTWALIHEIDPAWPNPHRDPDDPEGFCRCAPGYNPACPIHGDV